MIVKEVCITETVHTDNKITLKQSCEHLLCDTEFSDALDVICTALAQTAYLTKFTIIKRICGLPKVIDELQNGKTSHERRCSQEITISTLLGLITITKRGVENQSGSRILL